MGLLTKKLKIWPAAAEEVVSQNMLTSLPPKERTCRRLPSLHLLLCSTTVLLWLTSHCLNSALEHFRSQVHSLSRQETHPEKQVVFHQLRELNCLAETTSKHKRWHKEGGRTTHREEGEGICPSPFCGSQPGLLAHTRVKRHTQFAGRAKNPFTFRKDTTQDTVRHLLRQLLTPSCTERLPSSLGKAAADRRRSFTPPEVEAKVISGKGYKRVYKSYTNF